VIDGCQRPARPVVHARRSGGQVAPSRRSSGDSQDPLSVVRTTPLLDVVVPTIQQSVLVGHEMP